MRAGKLCVDRRVLLVSALIGGGIAIVGAGIYSSLVPGYVAWQLTDLRDLTRWIEYFRLNVQIQTILPGGDVWSGSIRGLIVRLAITNLMLLVGVGCVIFGIRAIVRERFRRRVDRLSEACPALAS